MSTVDEIAGTIGLPEGVLPWAAEYRDVLISRNRNAHHVAGVYSQICTMLELMGARQPGDLTRSRIERALGLIRAKGRSLRTVESYRVSFKAWCRWLADEETGYLPKDPCRSIPKYNAAADRRHSRRALTEDELIKLFAIMESTKATMYGLTGHDWAERFHLMLATGLREGTVGRLAVGQFKLDYPAGLQVYGHQESKGKRDRFISLRGDAADRIGRYLAGQKATDTAFPMPNKDAVLRTWRTLLSLAGIEYCQTVVGADGVVRRVGVVDIHSLRHTYGTRLARAGVPIKMAQELMGHSDPKLTMNIYSHVSHNETSAALEKLPPLPE